MRKLIPCSILCVLMLLPSALAELVGASVTGNHQFPNPGTNAIAGAEAAITSARLTTLEVTGTSITLTVNLPGSNDTNADFEINPQGLALDDSSMRPELDTVRTTPEPGSIALLGTGLLGLAGTLRRFIR